MPHNISDDMQHIWTFFADIHIRLKYTHKSVTVYSTLYKWDKVTPGNIYIGTAGYKNTTYSNYCCIKLLGASL